MMNKSVVKELRTIQEAHGLLRAEDVVDAARAKSSPLHHYFTWDDSEAARLYRITEARVLIRTAVEYKQIDDKLIEMQSFCSLTTDRTLVGGGYRSMVAVLESPSLRDQRLADLISELQRLQAKISQFRELREVSVAIDVATQKYQPKSVRHSRRPDEMSADA
jgi:hypothetical protein